MIAIVDYGAGNLASVCNAFDRLGHQAEICDRPAALDRHDRLILPGVGSFRAAMDSLNRAGWVDPLRAFADSGRPFLGICLGMQLLFDAGDEHGPTPGLGLIPGRVPKLNPAAPHRVPHVGWNNLQPLRPHPLLEGIKPAIDFYFVHSYHCVPTRPADVLATCDFGGPFVAAVAVGNIAAAQFHPEKSQPAGLKLLDNFAAWSPAC